MDIHSLQRQFLEYLEIEKGRSLKTVENYGRYMNRFIDMAGIKKASDITDDAVREFRLKLNRSPARDEGTLKKRTQNYYLIALRMFLKYLAKRGVPSLPPERIELASVGERELDLISPDDLARLLRAPDGADVKSLRDRAMMELLFPPDFACPNSVPWTAILILRAESFRCAGNARKCASYLFHRRRKRRSALTSRNAQIWTRRCLYISQISNLKSQILNLRGSLRAPWRGL